ncbi:MAG: ABC transporter substrate-binding protein [Pseudomonadota bacterium]
MINRPGNAALVFSLFTVLSLLLMGSALAEEPITVAALVGLSGPGSVAKGSIELDLGLKDCLAIANERGGINGKKIRYVMKDDSYKPDTAVRLFAQMMETEKPLAFFGSGTPAAIALKPVIQDRYRVLFTSSSLSAKLAFGGTLPMFVPGPTYGDQVGIALKYIAQQQPGAKIAFFYSEGPLGEDPIPYGRLMIRKLRLELAGEAVGDIKGGDHTAQVQELKRMNPDFVIIHGWVGPSNAPLIKQCHDMGLKSKIIVTSWGAMRSVVAALGPDGPPFLGVSGYAYWWMEDVPMIKTIRDYTRIHYPDVKERSLSYMVAFVAGQIFVECLRKADAAGKLSRDGVADALQSIKDFDTGGLTPLLTIRGNRFPVARIIKSNPAKGIYEPVTDWIKFY